MEKQGTTGSKILDILNDPTVALKFDTSNLLYVGLTIFAAITLSGLVVEGIKKLMR